MFTIRIVFTLFMVLSAIPTTMFAQKAIDLWQDKLETTFKRNDTERQIIPAHYRSLYLDFSGLKGTLKKVPERFSAAAKSKLVEFLLPMPDGSTQAFYITYAPVMHPDLAMRYPDIKSYAGIGIDDPSATLRFDVTPDGFHAMVLSSQTSSVFIDPYVKGDTEHYIAYYKKDYTNHLKKEFTCHVKDEGGQLDDFDKNTSRLAGDCQFRNFELALACTGEYATFHGGTVTSVLAAMNTTMTRVNGVYERDASITMTLIPNNDELIFLNGATDPYNNNDGGTMLEQNQTTCDNIIGANNYDIGHVFSTGGGGVATLFSPCGDRKARGVTGLANPVGDPFDIDYVCHEMGHQFGATHTFNNLCSGNITQNTAVEPGSGATIMGYAGICAPNIQNNSDAYFHGISVVQMGDFISSTTCADTINMNNNAPNVEAGGNYIIPRFTPFVLTAEGSDVDGNTLTYCWEQIDTEVATMPPLSSNDDGPLFRSFDSTTSPSRYFPRLSDLVSNNSYQWEVLPGVDRTMDFQCTVRDNNNAYGCTAEDNMMVTVDASAGPFEVIAPNTNGITWIVGTQETILWDVANTNQAPIEAAEVDIFLSFDGGYTYPYTLAENVPNSGAYTVEVPNLIGNENRVRIQGSDNIFFDISNRNFTIEAPPTPTYLMNVTPSSQSICASEGTVSYTVVIESLAGFDDNIDLSVQGLPAGAMADFSPASIDGEGTTVLTISGLENLIPQSYNMDIVATASENMSRDIMLTVLAGTPEAPTLLQPINGAENIAFSTDIQWSSVANATEYTIELASNPMFGDSTLFSGTISDVETVLQGLVPESIYYWRVMAANECGISVASNVYSFHTSSSYCLTHTMPNDILPYLLTDGGNTLYTFEMTNDDPITDVNIFMLIGHTWVGDLSASIMSPSSTEVRLFDQPGLPDIDATNGCGNDNIRVIFDDDAVLTAQDFEDSCNMFPPDTFAIDGVYQPLDALSNLNGESPLGTWQLNFNDNITSDIGAVFGLQVQICSQIPLSNVTAMTNNPLLVPQGGDADITNTNLEYTTDNAENTDVFFIITVLPTSGTLLLDGMPVTVGTIITQTDIDSGNLSYQHNGNAEVEDSFGFDITTNTNGWLPNQTLQINIIQNTLEANVNVDMNIDCNGNNNGQITINAMGGVAPLMYNLNGGAFQASPTFSGLGAGTYTAEVSDALGFTITMDALTLSNPPLLSVTTNANAQEITANAQGGTGDLTYSLDGINFQNSNVFSGVANGDYTVTVQDENNCTATSMVSISVNTLIVTADVASDVSCANGNDGSISVSVSGGAMPYEYSINNGASYQSENVFENLSGGTYTILVRDADGFTRTTDAVVISEPSIITASATVSANTITVIASGGTGALSYSVDGMMFQASNIFENLNNGAYIITVQDENNCTMTTNAIVAVNSLVVSATLVNDITCFNANNGVIEVNVGGGEMPYMYRLNDGVFQSDNVFDNLAAGTYTIEVQDASGFTMQSNAVTVVNPAPLSLSANVNGNEITVNASGGTGVLQYSINGGLSSQISNVFTDVENGTYTITVQDENGCVLTTMAIVSVNTLAVVANVIEGISCFNAADGTIEVMVTGGTPPYEYSIDGNNYQASNVFENLASGTYTIEVADNEGFVRVSNSVEIENPTLLTVTAMVDGSTVIVIASGGTGNLQYSLNGGTLQSNNVFENVANGDYELLVEDENACTAVTDVAVSINDLAVTLSALRPISCFDASDGALVVEVTGGTPPYQYSIDGNNFQAANTFEDIVAGTYMVEVFDSEGFSMVSNIIELVNPSELDLVLAIDGSTITATGSGGTGTLIYRLNSGNFSTSNVFENLADATYTITVQDENGCMVSMQAIVNTIPPLNIVVTAVTDISCHDVNDGQIFVQVNGGTPPYQYSLNNMAAQNSNTFTGLSEGSYTVMVQDANGIIRTEAGLIIENPDPITFTATAAENNITISDVQGGTGDYLYSIDGGQSTQSSPIFTDLENGTYEVGVIDENECTHFEVIIINHSNVQQLMDLDFQLYPNPSTGVFEIHLDHRVSKNIAVEIFDMLGRNVWSSTYDNTRFRVDAQELVSGSYQLRIQAGAEYGVCTLVIVK